MSGITTKFVQIIREPFLPHRGGMRFIGTVCWVLAGLFGLALIDASAEPLPPFTTLEPLEAPAAVLWADRQTDAAHREITSRPMAASVQAETEQLFSSPTFSQYGAFPVTLMIAGTAYSLGSDGLSRRTWDEVLAGAKGRPAASMSALSRQESGGWFVRPWDFITCAPDRPTDCEIPVSTSGLDQIYRREFNVDTAQPIDAAAFRVPEGRTAFAWINKNQALVAATPQGESTGDSPFPRTVRRWTRGEPLAQAVAVATANPLDIQIQPWIAIETGRVTPFVIRISEAPNRGHLELLRKGKTQPVAMPDRFEMIGALAGRIIFLAGADWSLGGLTIRSGDVAACTIDSLTHFAPRCELVFRPDKAEAIVSNQVTLGSATSGAALYLNVLHEGVGRILRLTRSRSHWKGMLLTTPPNGTATLQAVDPLTDQVLIAWEGPLNPPSLYAWTGHQLEIIATNPALFDATNSVIERRSAQSKDGTRIPYWLVRPRSMKPDGQTPTLVYGYGSFQTAALPEYNAKVGRLWIEKGGAYAIANIRGGGEFGPTWQQAATGMNKQRSFDDFAAVAEDLIQTGVTSSSRLGAFGRSAGGLLVTATALQHPDLFRAVLCEDGAVDLQYEYDHEKDSYLSEFANFNNPIERDEVQRYSPVRLASETTTSTRFLIVSHRFDQRVTAIASRRLQAAFAGKGTSSLLIEDSTGDHGSLSPSLVAEEYGFLSETLGL